MDRRDGWAAIPSVHVMKQQKGLFCQDYRAKFLEKMAQEVIWTEYSTVYML